MGSDMKLNGKGNSYTRRRSKSGRDSEDDDNPAVNSKNRAKTAAIEPKLRLEVVRD